MKQLTIYIITAVISIGLLNACGPDEEELRQQQQQAELDSLQQVWEAEMEQMRQDSIEQARLDSIAAAEEAEQQIEFDPNGFYTVQVQSWRSEEKAEQRADYWREQGFEHAYVVKFGDEKTGDIWFRVRLGNLSTREMAKQLTEKLHEDFNTDSWIAEAGQSR